MPCLMGLSAFQILDLLQNVKAAAPQGSRNQAPHAVPSYEATSQQTILHMLLQLQTTLQGESVGEGWCFTSNRGVGVLHTGDQTSLVAPRLPLRQERRLWKYFDFFGSTNSRTRVSSFCLV